MASLDREDQKWLMEQFTQMHSSISSVRTDMAVTRTELMGHMSGDSCRKIRKHESARHDIGRGVLRFVGLLSGSVGALVGLKALGLF